MTLQLNTLKPAKGANRKRKRVGCGPGSGHGKTACRGYNGQLSRSGTSVRPGFEGGQMPLHRRLPKRGFTNIFKLDYAEVNLSQLAAFPAGTVVDPAVLLKSGIVRKLKDGVKVLGNGELKQALTVKAQSFSQAAMQKINAAGGQVEVLR
jgi:large subunit ribosomal protein L15